MTHIVEIQRYNEKDRITGKTMERFRILRTVKENVSDWTATDMMLRGRHIEGWAKRVFYPCLRDAETLGVDPDTLVMLTT